MFEWTLSEHVIPHLATFVTQLLSLLCVEKQKPGQTFCAVFAAVLSWALPSSILHLSVLQVCAGGRTFIKTEFFFKHGELPDNYHQVKATVLTKQKQHTAHAAVGGRGGSSLMPNMA